MNNPFGTNTNPFYLKNSSDLMNSLNQNKLVWMVSERNSGKTFSIRSLLDKEKLKYFYINCNYFISFNDFFTNLALKFLNQEVVGNDISKIHDVLSTLKESFEEIKIELKIDNENTKINIEKISYSNIKKAMTEFFVVLKEYSEKNKIIVLFDEFDKLEMISDKKTNELDLLKEVLPNKASMIFIGSNSDLMQSFFLSEKLSKKNIVFFKMEDISDIHWRIYLDNVFKKNNIKLPLEILNYIVELSNNSPYYINIISREIYNLNLEGQTISVEAIKERLYSLRESFYKEQLDMMSINQKKAVVLIAKTKGVNVYKSEYLKSIGLSKSSMERCLTSFLTQNLILKNGINVRLKDPIFESWIVSNFME